ncbi:MAG: hypothetical protein BWY63_01624 [Chloroflexi bacterium ADurb.Bin360]|nr:MAG: hypothetical protein BWY63_01624 [Chloroflexi bacterium ADurb.Bin360]
MNRKQAEMHIVFLERLPKCAHGHWLMDWGFNPLEPPCGCRLDEETEAPGIVPGDFWAEVTSEAESQLGPEATELL